MNLIRAHKLFIGDAYPCNPPNEQREPDAKEDRAYDEWKDEQEQRNADDAQVRGVHVRKV